MDNVIGFKALQALRLENLRIPPTYSKHFQCPPHNNQTKRDELNKYERPLLGCTITPKLGYPQKKLRYSSLECLHDGLPRMMKM